MVAYTASTWTGVIVALSIFVPLVVAIVLAFVVLRKDNPDEERLRRVQEEYERARRER